MNTLNYNTLEQQNYQGYLLKKGTERVLQFGEGNFLRGFVDYFIDVANETLGDDTKVVVVQPIAQGLADMVNEQEGLYTLYLRGNENGEKVSKKRVISCIQRCLNPYNQYTEFLDCAKNPDLEVIVSNTTEAGIVYDPTCGFDDAPATSFPAKLTRFLYERFTHFGQEKGKGFVVLSCELIDHNGKELSDCVMKYIDQWGLSPEFKTWVETENHICSTLVDRIVTGYPRDEVDALNEENGYKDQLINTGESFGFWVIEGEESLKERLPFTRVDLPILVTPDHTPYKNRKVRILNGAHTSMVLGAYLSGQDIVRHCMDLDYISGFMNKTLKEEIIPTLTLPKAELEEFAASVKDRFQNPFIDHALLAISLNSTSKWRARVMPSFKGYVEQFSQLPPCITFSFAAYVAFYRCHSYENGVFLGKRAKGDTYTVNDDVEVLEFYAQHKDSDVETLVSAVASNVSFWGEDLSKYDGFVAKVVEYMEKMDSEGVEKTMAGLL